MTKEVTSKVISLFPRNDGNSRYNKLYQTDPKLILTVIKINWRLQNKNVVRRPIAFSEANLVVVYYIVFVKKIGRAHV